MFKILLYFDGVLFCNIAKNAPNIDLIKRMIFIIYNEVLIQYCYCVETIDRIFYDINNTYKLFGRITIVFCGDFDKFFFLLLKTQEKIFLIILCNIQRFSIILKYVS